MGKLELVHMASGPVGRATFEPGWGSSKHVKPIAKTDSCQAAHRHGRRRGDGVRARDFAIAPPGHDVWIVGDEPCVVIDWQGSADYATRSHSPWRR
jgi:hypothetical protein